MAQKSSIEWTESTWNPVTGCTKISTGCKNCYAERMAMRLQAMGQANYVNGFDVTPQPHMLELPLRWKKPQTVFVNSMSDLFHKDVSVSYMKQVFDVMSRAHWHRFQVLTKRSERLTELDPELTWAPNIWMGVSVETERYTSRIDDLRETRAVQRLACGFLKLLFPDIGSVTLNSFSQLCLKPAIALRSHIRRQMAILYPEYSPKIAEVRLK